MFPKTFIFIGRSGCGKGTQAKILHQRLSERDAKGRPIIYLETGARFREFIKRLGYSNRLAAQIAATGQRQPDFLAVWNWAHVLIEEMKGDEHLIVDGMPRSRDEALVFDSAITFYKREKPTVIYLDVSREWSYSHLKSRAHKEARADDVEELIQRRLSWFDTDVYPVVTYLRNHPGYQFLHINGEQGIDDVAKAIVSGLNW